VSRASDFPRRFPEFSRISSVPFSSRAPARGTFEGAPRAPARNRAGSGENSTRQLGTAMNATQQPERRVRKAIGKLLDAVDASVKASKAVEQARRELERETERLRGLRVVGGAEGDES